MLRLHALTLFLSLAALSSPACSGERELEPGSSGAPAMQSGSRQPANSPPATPARPVSTTPDGYKGPLPAVPSSPHAAAPREVIHAVYEFAARRPDVLRHVPCFCGCERNGHQGNEDCFVAARGADGRPQWDVHGLT